MESLNRNRGSSLLRRAFAALALVLLAGAPAIAQDAEKFPVEIPATAVAPAAQVRGLRMEFYPFNPDLPKGRDSLDEAMIFIATGQPLVVTQLDVPTIDFPKGARIVSDIATSLGDYFWGGEAFAARKAV